MTDARRKPSCHRDSDGNWLGTEHLHDCASPTCTGCRPCGEDHCELSGRCPNHVDHAAGLYACPSCIGRTRRNVRQILDRYALVDVEVEARGADLGQLLEQAAESGVDSEAFNLVGPAADPGQYTAKRTRLQALYERQGWCDWPRHEGFRDDDPHHPYAVLARWDATVRESYGPQSDLFTTVSSAVDYLTGKVLDTFAHTKEFEDFAHDVAQCLTHLEAVLSDSREPEKGAPCPACETSKPRLVKRYAEHRRKGGRPQHGPLCHCGHDGPGHCRVCAGHDDTWHCPAQAEHWWSDADYRLRVDGAYLEHATKLTMSDLPERTGVSASTLRRWAGRTQLGIVDGETIYGPPRLKARGRNHQGRKLYLVADVIALRDTIRGTLDSRAAVGEH